LDKLPVNRGISCILWDLSPDCVWIRELNQGLPDNL
jgi:hypothetical protein